MAYQAPPAAPRPDWWNEREPRVPEDPAKGEGKGKGRGKDTVKYTTLGLLKQQGHWQFEFLEWWYLVFIRECLTTYWGIIQRGSGAQALERWNLIFLVLELDRKAQLDLMLLAHTGLAGRAEANEILWDLLSIWALKDDYLDLSHKVTSMVGRARRNLDRPPRNHPDREWWTWTCYWEPRRPSWSPRAVPDHYEVITGPNGEPLAPPACFGYARRGA